MEYSKDFLKIAKNYEYFIFDVWGVIHDGQSAYPNAVETIEELRSQNKKICFLSNAPRRAFKVAEVLQNYGIEKKHYDFIMTSGEATFQFLEEKQENGAKNYFYIGPKKDEDLLDGLEYNRVFRAKDADFAITTGYDDFDSVIDEKDHELAEIAQENLELICVNPDMIVVKKTGEEMLCAGQIAKKYEEMGQKVRYFGKPYGEIYEFVFKKFNCQNYKEKVLAIGDGIETDILGANRAGIDNILLTCGILSNKLQIKYGQEPNLPSLQKIFEEVGIFPKFIAPNL